MDPKKLLLVSITAMSIFLYMFPQTNSEEAFPPEADGPTAESPDLDELELSPGPPPRVVNVDDYGARADDGVDDTEALLGAWNEACNSDHPSMFLVPKGKTYLLKPVSFNGPCRATTITAMIQGTLEAPSNRSVWLDSNLQEWITFENIDGLHVLGGGTLNGNGHEWWINSCKVNKSKPCVSGPTALNFRGCTHLVVEDLEMRDSMQMHVVIADSRKVLVSKLFVTAPGWSPNTDGIHVSNSKEVLISGCIIRTGDDCISIVSGSVFVRATGIVCGPGHGISIGSLGANNSWAQVSDVLVENATLVGTTNGVRIKTWQGGDGYAERITFQDISMYNVSNPVIIDQNYCDSKTPCYEQIVSEDCKLVSAGSCCDWKEIVGKIMEQVRAESEQWTEMQDMLEQVRLEIQELQSSRDTWQRRAIASDISLRSLNSQMLEWKHRAHVSEQHVEELQKKISELQSKLLTFKAHFPSPSLPSQEWSEACKMEENPRTKAQHHRSQECGNEKEKHVLICRVKHSPSVISKRSPFQEIGNISLPQQR